MADPFQWHDKSLRERINDIFADPDAWIASPNDQLGGMTPLELIDSEDEKRLEHLLDRILFGFAS